MNLLFFFLPFSLWGAQLFRVVFHLTTSVSRVSKSYLSYSHKFLSTRDDPIINHPRLKILNINIDVHRFLRYITNYSSLFLNFTLDHQLPLIILIYSYRNINGIKQLPNKYINELKQLPNLKV